MAKRAETAIAVALVTYLLIVGIGAVVIVITNFPGLDQNVVTFPKNAAGVERFVPFGVLPSVDQGLLLLALFAGIAGSFLHAAQSLSSYIGNAEFKSSWTAWYFLRPWVGGVLGFALYFALRAGLVGGVNAVNPYGVVALGLLGGWFSKTTTDKLQEVFETLFKTNADAERKDKLQTIGRPIIEEVQPGVITPSDRELRIIGQRFSPGARVQIAGQEVQAEFVSSNELRVMLADLTRRPTKSVTAVRVKNAKGSEPLSQESDVTFE